MESEFDGALVLTKLLLVDQHDDLRAKDLVVDALVGRELRGVQRVDLAQHALPVLEIGLLRGGIDAGQLGDDLRQDDSRRLRRAALCAMRLPRCRWRAGEGLPRWAWRRSTAAG